MKKYQINGKAKPSGIFKEILDLFEGLLVISHQSHQSRLKHIFIALAATL
jgi:hypothetical protein